MKRRDGAGACRIHADAHALFPISQLGAQCTVTKANYRVVLVQALNLHNDGPEMILAAEAQFQRAMSSTHEHCTNLPHRKSLYS